MPGSGPQSARGYTFFRNPVGVLVRDDYGRPIAGAAVELIGPYRDDGGSYLWYRGFAGLTTDDNGIAVIPGGVIAGGMPVVVELRAKYGGVETTLPHLTVLPHPVARLQLVSGDDQAARPSLPFPKPWKVQALDAAGRPVPYAAVAFGDRWDNDWRPTALFDNDWFVMADEMGVASAQPRANAVTGRGSGWGCSLNGCVDFSFEIYDRATPYSMELLSAPPDSLETTKATMAPFVVRVTNHLGRPLKGARVWFNTAEELPWSICGSFGPSGLAEVYTDEVGIAVSPMFTSFQWYGCDIRIGGGFDYDEIDFRMRVFDPDDVLIHAPTSIKTMVGRRFSFKVSFTAKIPTYDDGVQEPIYGLPVQVQVVSGPGGASAVLARSPTAPYSSNEATLEFNANSIPGSYQIAVIRGPVRTLITVDQRR